MDEKNHQLLQLLQKTHDIPMLNWPTNGVPNDIDHKLNHLIETGIIRQFTTVINDNHIDDTPLKHWSSLAFDLKKIPDMTPSLSASMGTPVCPIIWYLENMVLIGCDWKQS